MSKPIGSEGEVAGIELAYEVVNGVVPEGFTGNLP
ncbi:hypothetical protein J2T12_000872 [Paenibacillus anaericanus]|nr:hypothetical protein [Paenibacillus anaericanus]